MTVIQKKEPKVIQLNDFWSNFILWFSAFGFGITINMIINFFKR